MRSAALFFAGCLLPSAAHADQASEAIAQMKMCDANIKIAAQSHLGKLFDLRTGKPLKLTAAEKQRYEAEVQAFSDRLRASADYNELKVEIALAKLGGDVAKAAELEAKLAATPITWEHIKGCSTP